MMKYFKNQHRINISIIAVIGILTMVSCGPAKNDSRQSADIPEQQQNQEQNTAVNPELTNETQEADNEANTSDTKAAASEQPQPEENNAQVMINPPHGEPGHRCEIPVGAPLNSSPANTAQTTEQNNADVMLNPPHGEPGHRCDIPVGQPLNAAPAQQTKSPSLANNPLAPTIENARRLNGSQTRTTTQANSGTKPRLNPPHGQPWHRCDIAVGSPLP